MPARTTRAERQRLKKPRKTSAKKNAENRGKSLKKKKKLLGVAPKTSVSTANGEAVKPAKAEREKLKKGASTTELRPVKGKAGETASKPHKAAGDGKLKADAGVEPSGASKVAAKKDGGIKPKKAKAAKVKKVAKSSLRPPPPLKHYTFIGVPSFTGPKPVRPTLPPPPPPPPRPVPATLEERIARLQERLDKQKDDFRSRYQESLDMSWIYHDSALEGVVYSFVELKTAMDPNATVLQDSSLQPICEEIRRHKQAIEFVRDSAKKKLPFTLDVVKRIYLILHPEEGDLKTVKYRKDIPQHRLYFHEYTPPDKIAYKVRQIVDWVNDPETRKGRNALRIAARAHYDFLRVFPFTSDSGKVARLMMNLLLMRAGFEPAIVHATERQKYYEALKGSAAVILHMVQEAEENALSSIEKMLDEHETSTRSFVS